MSFTDDDLDTALTSLYSKSRILNEKRQELRDIERNLESLKKIERRTQNPSGGFDVVKEEPIDQGTNKTMTATRKNEVYTKSKARLDVVQV